MNVVSELVRPLLADHLRMCQIGSMAHDGFSLICDSIRNSTSKFYHCEKIDAYEVAHLPMNDPMC
jgi:hypothetical protein